MLDFISISFLFGIIGLVYSPVLLVATNSGR